MLRFRLASAQSESDSAIPRTDTAIMDIRDTTMVITRAAITAITGVTHLTETITLGGLIIDTTRITSVIITIVTKRME